MSTQHVNRWDSLLAWLSQKHSYSLATIKTASLRLSMLSGKQAERSPIGHAMYWAGCLITLGHAEFDPTNNRISAVTPGILRSGRFGRSVLYGYWGPKLFRGLLASGFRLQTHRPKKGPSCYSLRGDSNSLKTLCDELNVWIADDVGSLLLSRIPTVSTAVSQFSRSEVSADGSWEVFDYRSNHRLLWRAAKDPLVEPGFYRSRSGTMAFVYVDAAGRRFTMKSKDERAIAKWDRAPKEDWLFDPSLQRLLIPYGMPELPLLVSRCLTMSSARMPVLVKFAGTRWWNYVSVGEDEAREAARILEQELKTRSLFSV